ncbi:MAG TPA: hypothetical protein VLW86_06245 [Syntrophorhabdales bacterium]|nr:hypothetical protein [Syntrophorhabdales bacterium]
MATRKTSRAFRTLHLKELLSLGLKKGQITNIVQKADIFKDIPRQQGYAIDYTFNQAVLLHVGGELSKLGVSFRHINKILIDLAGLDFEKNRERIARGRLVMFVFSRGLMSDDNVPVKGVWAGIPGKSPGSGRRMSLGSSVRMAPISLRLLRERDAPRMDDSLDHHVRINLYRIVAGVMGLLWGPTQGDKGGA